MSKFTLEYLQDYAEIRALSAMYNRYANTADGDQLSLLFLEDGEFCSNGQVYRGRRELARVVSSAREIVHITTDALIDVEGDEATQTSQKISVRRQPDKSLNRFVSTGRYIDRLVRTEVGWRFQRRESQSDLRSDLHRRAMNLTDGRLGS